MVRNVHERLIQTPPDAPSAGALIDNLGVRDAALWPRDRWPAMRFDRALGVGARGGHGPIRYFVEDYAPGRNVRFRFTAPRGFDGTHDFNVEQASPGVIRVRHTIEMRLKGAARLSWPLMFRPLHDALVEDALDRAEANLKGAPAEPRRLSAWVRFLRRAARLLT